MGRDEIFKSIASLVKYNEGKWKSEKQAEYLTKMVNLTGMNMFEPSIAKIEVVEGRKYLTHDYHMSFAEYGYRSQRVVTFFYEFNKVGVTRVFKIHYNYSTDGKQRWVNPDRTEMIQEFPLNFVEPEVTDEVEVPENDTKHFGEVGTRYKVQLKCEKIIDRGFGMYGQEWLSIFTDENGNTFFWNNRKVAEGEVFEGKATVKKHIIDKKNTKVTVLSRLM